MAVRFPRARISIAVLLLLVGAGAARADDYGDPSGRAWTAVVDVRGSVADGERSWLDGGFGKARFGGEEPNDGGANVRLRPVEGDVAWQPAFSWSLGALVSATAQQGQEHAVDLSEAYLVWRMPPRGALKLSARGGLFWPPVSLEHSGPEWRVTETITPSAINSWIGEEVKLLGVEGTASLPLAGGRISATAAAFGYNDTSGTLIAFRGWALHDEKATAFGRQPLPPLNAFMQYAQAPLTRPVIELDDRAGFYGRIGWTLPDRISLHAFYYDNRGDPEAVNDQLQWGWRTRFAEAGLRWQAAGRTTLTAQELTGRTEMGYKFGGRIWVDTRFRSAFALVTRALGAGSISARIEGFGTRGHGSILGPETGEDGWAATFAARRAIGEHLSLLGEILHVESDREDRARIGLDPHENQTVFQLALRLRS